jgi:hypothetical protein
MSKTLTAIAEQLRDANKKVQLIYAFNGTGKTRLSRAFKALIAPKAEGEEAQASDLANKKVLYYSAFTEDLFYWQNDLERDVEPKLIIQPIAFTRWVLEEQGQDQSTTATFQGYTSDKLTPHFSNDFSSVSFSFERGNEQPERTSKLGAGSTYRARLRSVLFSRFTHYPKTQRLGRVAGLLSVLMAMRLRPRGEAVAPSLLLIIL